MQLAHLTGKHRPYIDSDVDKAMEYGNSNSCEKQRVLCVHIDGFPDHGVDNHCIFRVLTLKIMEGSMTDSSETDRSMI